MNSMPSSLRMSTEEFRLIRDLIYRHCGLHFTEDTRFLLESRLGGRLRQLGLRTYRDYYVYLRFHQNAASELELCIDLLTTNETYFFREQHQLRAFSEEILPRLYDEKSKRRERTLRIWSAGCSTGEEPYTIAMLLLEQEQFADWTIEIIGTDISQRVLRLARQGVYGKNAFRTTDREFIDKYFDAVSDRHRIREEVRSLVSFGHLNLLDTHRIALLPMMDIIFCRNVFIYFDEAVKKRVAQLFHDKLVPGGYLLLGHSESLVNITGAFSLEHLRNDLVYRKPEES